MAETLTKDQIRAPFTTRGIRARVVSYDPVGTGQTMAEIEPIPRGFHVVCHVIGHSTSQAA